MKKYRLKSNVKDLMLFGIFVILVGIAIFKLKSLDDEFMKNCQESGYSKYYCELHK